MPAMILEEVDCKPVQVMIQELKLSGWSMLSSHVSKNNQRYEIWTNPSSPIGQLRVVYIKKKACIAGE